MVPATVSRDVPILCGTRRTRFMHDDAALGRRILWTTVYHCVALLTTLKQDARPVIRGAVIRIFMKNTSRRVKNSWREKRFHYRQIVLTAHGR
jgi:hypothetical protein